MKLNDVKDNPGAHKRRMRVGRGIGSGKGKTCGRGVKGQTSRTGVAIKGFEGGQMPIHRRLPKRGFNHARRTELETVNLGDIEKAVESERLDINKQITVDALKAAGLVRGNKDGVKLLAKGAKNFKLKLIMALEDSVPKLFNKERPILASKAADKAISKAGREMPPSKDK